MSRVRFGYLRLTVMLKREGWAVGKKLVYRLYRELGLQMRTKKRRKLASEQRGPVESAVRANQRWSMDFITDRLENGRYFRTLTVVDQYTRECPVLEAAHSLTAAKVVDALDTVSSQARLSRIDHRGQRQRVLQPRDGCVGLPSRREAGLHSGPASRWRTDISRASTGDCGTNASTSSCSGQSRTPALSSKSGGWTTMSIARIAH